MIDSAIPGYLLILKQAFEFARSFCAEHGVSTFVAAGARRSSTGRTKLPKDPSPPLSSPLPRSSLVRRRQSAEDNSHSRGHWMPFQNE